MFQGAEIGLPRENGDQSSNVTMRADWREKIWRFEESTNLKKKTCVVKPDWIILDNWMIYPGSRSDFSNHSGSSADPTQKLEQAGNDYIFKSLQKGLQQDLKLFQRSLCRYVTTTDKTTFN